MKQALMCVEGRRGGKDEKSWVINRNYQKKLYTHLVAKNALFQN